MPSSSRCMASIEVAIVSRLLEASWWPAPKAATPSSEGRATKSLEAVCIRAKAALNSRLASASTAALLTLSKVFSTSVSPLVKARPLARKPTTGMTAIAAMRLRTESFEISRWMENIGNRMAGTDPLRSWWPSSWPVEPRETTRLRNSQNVNKITNLRRNTSKIGTKARWWPPEPRSAFGLSGLDVAEEAVDLGIEAFGFDRERIGERLDLGGGGAGVLGGTGDAAHGLGAALRLVGGALNPLGDLGDCLVLLLDGGRHRDRDGGDFLDDVVDLPDRLRGVGDRRLDGTDLAGDLLGGLGGLPGERLHLRGDDREALAGFAGPRCLDGGIEGEQIGLAGNRLNEPDHLADTGGGAAELRHGLDGAPRVLDGAGGDFAGAGRLLGDVSDRGGELFDRAGRRRHVAGRDPDPLLGGARFGRNFVGGAVELRGGDLQALARIAHLGQHLVHRRLEPGDGGGDLLAASLALAVGGGLIGRQPLALQRGVAEHQNGARHGAQLSLGVRGRYADRGVPRRQPRHRIPQPVERARDAAADPPAKRQPDQRRHAADPDDELLGARLRCRQRRRRGSNTLARVAEDLVGDRDHALGVAIDQYGQGAHRIDAGDPLLKRVGIGLNLVAQLLAHARRAVHRIEERVEMRDLVQELPANRRGPVQSVLGLETAHGQKGDHELPGVLVGHPGQLLVNDALDRRPGRMEAAPEPIRLGEAEAFLLLLHLQETVPCGRDASVERGQSEAFGLAYRALDRVQTLRGLSAAGIEGRGRLFARICDEIPKPDPHGREPGLEFLAGLGNCRRTLDAPEGAFNVGLTGGECNAIGQEADERDHRNCDD